MQNDTSQFVVNIIPLQNIQTNTSGFDATTELSNAIANIQEMVNFEQKRVFTDSLSAYTTNGTIQVLSPMNMSDVPFTLSGLDFSGTAGTGGGGSLTISSLIVGGNITIAGSGTFTGSVSATSFITVSDSSAKTDIHKLEGPFLNRVKGLYPYRFRYSLGLNNEATQTTTPTVGLMAQDVENVLPEAVHLDAAGRRLVNYDSILALLVGAVKELEGEIAELKSRL